MFASMHAYCLVGISIQIGKCYVTLTSRKTTVIIITTSLAAEVEEEETKRSIKCVREICMQKNK